MTKKELFYFYKYLLSVQKVPDQSYLNAEPVSNEIRATTVEWMGVLCSHLSLENAVFHHSVHIFDKYLSCCDITTAHLHLLATASIFISCKYEEAYPPKIDWFVSLMDQTLTKKDLLEMESKILKALDFHLRFPTSNVFLSIFAEVISLKNKNHYLASYYCELSLLTTSSRQFSFSSLAASSIILANVVLKVNDPWPEQLFLFSDLELSELGECIKFINTLACAALDSSQTKGARDRFGDWRFESVSKIDQPKDLER